MNKLEALALAADERRVARVRLRAALDDALADAPSRRDYLSVDPNARRRVGQHDLRVRILRHLRHTIDQQEVIE